MFLCLHFPFIEKSKLTEIKYNPTQYGESPPGKPPPGSYSPSAAFLTRRINVKPRVGLPDLADEKYGTRS